MYLSRLILNQNRAAELWQSNPYRIHQRLMMGCDGEPRLLFRLETEGDVRQILVQSHVEPDWMRAFGKLTLVRMPVEYKFFQPGLIPGGIYRFRLRANPTARKGGKRLGLLHEEDQHAWLARKLVASGAELVDVLVRPEGFIHSSKHPGVEEPNQTMLSVLFEGTLKVVSPDQFQVAIENGVGSGKGYGFGLISLARL